MAPSPAKAGYAKLSLEEDEDILEPSKLTTEEQVRRHILAYLSGA